MEQDSVPRPHPQRWVSRGALAVGVVASCVVIDRSPQLASVDHVALVATAVVAYVAMLAADRRWGGLSIGLVASGMGAAALVALSGPAHFTGDLWSYAMYGRMVAAHHASPYTHIPADFRGDPILQQVGRGWRHTPSVYGPAFTALSTIGAVITGAAVLATRVLYQLIAIGALAAASVMVWRRTRSPGAVAFLGLHPMVLMFVMSGARNDILVGLAALGAVVLTERGRPATGGVVGALGALIKVTGVVALVAVGATAYARGDHRALRRLAAGGAGTIALGYALAGPASLFTPMNTAGALFSRASAWKALPALGFALPDAHVALAVLAVLVLVVLARHARGDAAPAVAASLTMLALGASWALPGYAVWGMPAAALDHRSAVARISAATGLVLLLTYEILRQPIAGSPGLVDVAVVAGPLAMVALVVALLRTRASAPAPRRNPVASPRTTPTPAYAPLARTLVVIPTIDERLNIQTVLERVRRAAPDAQILVVDDGSTDGTPEIAEWVATRLGRIRVVRRDGPRGLGAAYQFAFALALAEGFETVVEMDADLSHDPHDLPALIAAVDQGADLAIGSRYVDGGLTVGWPAHRKALSRVGGWYARRLLASSVHDITSGFRAYRADLLRAMDLDSVDTVGYGFQIEMTHRAEQVGARITEVPIVFRERSAGASKMSTAIVGEALLMVARTAARDRGASRPVPARVAVGEHAG
jgi:dolichol-phosphate mannosyltransferase